MSQGEKVLQIKQSFRNCSVPGDGQVGEFKAESMGQTPDRHGVLRIR